ncbi:MAG TPA: hypothetical protein TECP_00163 [Hyphomicrobiaceae bacterium MAG_BT-2024]
MDSITFDEFVGAIVSSCRVEARLSQLHFAVTLEITLMMMKKIESGNYRPSAALIIEILRYFDMSLTDLIEEYADLFTGSRHVHAYDNVIFLSRK